MFNCYAGDFYLLPSHKDWQCLFRLDSVLFIGSDGTQHLLDLCRCLLLISPSMLHCHSYLIFAEFLARQLPYMLDLKCEEIYLDLIQLKCRLSIFVKLLIIVLIFFSVKQSMRANKWESSCFLFWDVVDKNWCLTTSFTLSELWLVAFAKSNTPPCLFFRPRLQKKQIESF